MALRVTLNATLSKDVEGVAPGVPTHTHALKGAEVGGMLVRSSAPGLIVA
jgi:hypothetical protein